MDRYRVTFEYTGDDDGEASRTAAAALAVVGSAFAIVKIERASEYWVAIGPPEEVRR
jgi:hypothetical protein